MRTYEKPAMEVVELGNANILAFCVSDAAESDAIPGPPGINFPGHGGTGNGDASC